MCLLLLKPSAHHKAVHHVSEALWLPSGVINCTLGTMSEELVLRMELLLRIELFLLMELRFLKEFWWDSSLFCRVWMRMEGFSSSSRALQRGAATLTVLPNLE